MTSVELLDFLAKLGPLAREHGIESVELEDTGPSNLDLRLKGAKFHRVPQMVPVPIGQKKPDEGPAKPPVRFGGRDAEEIRNAIPNWGSE